MKVPVILFYRKWLGLVLIKSLTISSLLFLPHGLSTPPGQPQSWSFKRSNCNQPGAINAQATTWLGSRSLLFLRRQESASVVNFLRISTRFWRILTVSVCPAFLFFSLFLVAGLVKRFLFSMTRVTLTATPRSLTFDVFQ